MTQSAPRKARRESKKRTAPVKRNLTPTETLQFQEMNRTINSRKWEAAQLAGNTALIPNGQAYVEQLAASVAVLDDVGRQWLCRTLEACGYPNGTKCDVNLNTGEITLSSNEPEDSK